MDFSKLKLDKFQTYNGFQLPESFHPPLTLDPKADVWFLFCHSFEDVNRLANQVINQPVPKENRVFFVYRKGRKEFHRDHIYAVIERHPFLMKKAPILSSLNHEYNCFATNIKK